MDTYTADRAETNDERALATIGTSRALTVPPQPTILRPIVTAAEAKEAIAEYEALKAAIIRTTDLQRISNKDYIKKSGWLRIARAFGLTVEPVSERHEAAEDGSWGYAIVVRALAPNGASMQGDGMCWSTEKPKAQQTRHNVRAHAYTRATNRAISNLVGGGEVSAEEMQEEAADTQAMWTEIKRLADDLGLSDNERKEMTRRHKRNVIAIYNELHARSQASKTIDADVAPAKPTATAAAPTPIRKRSWPSLHARAFKADIVQTEEQWADVVCELTGKNDPKAINMTGDYDTVEAFIADMELKQAAQSEAQEGQADA